jgi:hypothetical protein
MDEWSGGTWRLTIFGPPNRRWTDGRGALPGRGSRSVAGYTQSASAGHAQPPAQAALGDIWHSNSRSPAVSCRTRRQRRVHAQYPPRLPRPSPKPLVAAPSASSNATRSSERCDRRLPWARNCQDRSAGCARAAFQPAPPTNRHGPPFRTGCWLSLSNLCPVVKSFRAACVRCSPDECRQDRSCLGRT